jgi:bifunctional UDP-N-acetylglucosamine pyrophosphorylase/glucosamine-1-phosphate N-acetyltransferase
VLQTQEALRGFRGDVLILYGDTPLLRSETLAAMRRHKDQTGADLVMLTAAVDVPGIVVRDERGRVTRVVEATDASPHELAIEERNTGVYLLDAELLWKTLAQVDDDNAQGEIYLTTIVELAVHEGRRVEALQLDDADEARGVNDRADLAAASSVMRDRILRRWMREGVTFVDPQNSYVDADAVIGADTFIEPGCTIQGASRIGERVHLRPGCMIESSEIGEESVIGPNAHLRPGCRLGRGVRIGNYVEVKNSVLGDGVKADHLSYIGDADVGAGAAFGCGAITVNYDWKIKHRTTVGERATIGCNVNLVAPVEIGADAAVAAGSTITRDVSARALSVARSRQTEIANWSLRRGLGRAAASRATARSAPVAGAAVTGTTKRKAAATKPAPASRSATAKKPVRAGRTARATKSASGKRAAGAKRPSGGKPVAAGRTARKKTAPSKSGRKQKSPRSPRRKR